jgi:glycosyltransferase involved in cell wall biosynthesis
MHSWGGGLERWVQDYCRGDNQNSNLILKSIGEYGIPAKVIALYQHIDDSIPIRIWQLEKPIRATSASHLEYRYILQEIIEMFPVDYILISSLIGHSLELLNTRLKTVIICHDFYPFCPVIVAYFKGNCQECNFSHLKICFSENPIKFFPFTSAIEWMEIRNTLIFTLQKQKIPLILPSPFIKDRLISLDSKFAEVSMFVISHGISSLKIIQQQSNSKANKKLHILILGRLSAHKGFDLFSQICDSLGEVAEIYLLGCGDSGYSFKDKSHIHIVPEYKPEELAQIVNNLHIDLGLLLSTWTETFSYTLSELMSLGIPTLTTNIGSFADRIEEGVNGFLVNPDPKDIINKVNTLSKDREFLRVVHKNLLEFKHKGTEEMISEYQDFFNIIKIDTPNLLDDSLDILNLEKIVMEIKFNRNQIEKLQLGQENIVKQMEYKEFYPNWYSLKKRWEPISQRFRIFKRLKQMFPRAWEQLRKLAIYFKLLH